MGLPGLALLDLARPAVRGGFVSALPVLLGELLGGPPVAERIRVDLRELVIARGLLIRPGERPLLKGDDHQTVDDHVGQRATQPAERRVPMDGERGFSGLDLPEPDATPGGHGFEHLCVSLGAGLDELRLNELLPLLPEVRRDHLHVGGDHEGVNGRPDAAPDGKTSVVRHQRPHAVECVDDDPCLLGQWPAGPVSHLQHMMVRADRVRLRVLAHDPLLLLVRAKLPDSIILWDYIKIKF